MKKVIFLSLFVILSLFGHKTLGQINLDSLDKICSSFIKYPYIPEGQEFRAFVINGETAEFYYTFYGGAVYRLVFCSSVPNKSPIFRIYDSNHKLIFSSEYYNNPKYWDLKFTSTIEAVIEAELPETDLPSAVITLLIGFK